MVLEKQLFFNLTNHMKRHLILPLFIIFSFSTLAQIPVKLSKGQVKLMLIGPGISYETKISEKSSMTIHARLGSELIRHEYAAPSQEPTRWYYAIYPNVTFEKRVYYDRKKVKKKNLLPNSGNYYGMVAGYNFGIIADSFDNPHVQGLEDESFFAGPVWGMQRNYRSGFHFGFSIGLGLLRDKHANVKGTGLADLTIGFVIN